MSRSIDEILENIETATAEEILRATDGIEVGAEVIEEAAKQDDTAEVAESATPGAVVDQIEAPVQARDGKHTIPYEVLANTRSAKEAAEAARADLQAKLDALQTKMEKAESSATEVAHSAMTPEEIVEMESVFPAMAKAYQSMQSDFARLQKEVAAQTQARNEVQQAEVSSTIQDLIDANPKLAYLQSSDPTAWQRAVEIDDQLRTNPATAKLSMAERFTKAAAAYEAIYGAINAPAPVTPVVKTVDQVLAKAKPVAPRSLSDLPGGSFVESNEVGNLENLTAYEIGNNLMKMSAKQRDAYLNSLG